MKFFLLVLLFGLAAALPHSGVYRDEGEGDDIKTELGKKLKEHLEDIMAKIKDAVDHGKEVKTDLIEKMKEIREKMKELKIDLSDKVKEMWEKVKNKVADWFRKLWEKKDDNDVSRRDLKDLKEKFNNFICRLKDKLQQRLDEGKIEEFIREKVPESMFRKRLLDILKRGESHLRRVVEFLADKCDDVDDNDVEKRAIRDYLDHLIDMLKKVRLTTKEKFDSFVEFLKETYDGGKEVLKDKATFVRDLARHFLEHAEKTSKKVAEEALKFFRVYKDDLGNLYHDLEEKVKEIVKH